MIDIKKVFNMPIGLKALLCFFIFTESLMAQETLDFTIHQEYTSTRALGMGNAFTALADDHSAMFYNPAALARRKDGQIRMFIRAGIDDSFIKLNDDIQKVSKDKNITEINKVIEDHFGDHFYSRVPTIGGVWVRPNWGIAVIPADLSIDIGIHQQVGPRLDINGYLDTTIAYSYARNFKWFGKKSKFSMGLTLKALHRVHGTQSIDAAKLIVDSDLFKKEDAAEGLTVDGDFGILYTPYFSKKSWLSFLRGTKPSFSFVTRNIGDYGFPQNFHVLAKDSKEPPKLQRRFDVGSLWDLPNFWVFDPHFTVDIRDIGHQNWSPLKGFHAGAELYWKMFNWWKGSWAVGINQGYWTAGVGARLAWFQLDIATWGEEVGTKDLRNESRRYIVEMSLDF